jgi:hypothetical protein
MTKMMMSVAVVVPANTEIAANPVYPPVAEVPDFVKPSSPWPVWTM